MILVFICTLPWNMARWTLLKCQRPMFNMHVTGIEGRAGMAAIVDTAKSIDLRQFNRNLQQRLPTYARPVFLRLLDKLDLTG